ncbi:DUF1540 domain-containing protein [Rarobacter faecitabidus]|uniref:Uncharacterized protein DUF1540 n=1 Tax=Rarobacter faecitabidus TaxID=13243 RepID=A0A542ZAQ2_RARFA|nr:DUF1540 domain-containing protein [Rarobacter faecitabidus]TQL57371.1 uncharacterized protein DUF1540 [Rarobacter faecitabidus]
MSTVADLPHISECSVAGCSYNSEHSCHAGAVTIAQSSGSTSCATFIPLGIKGGLDRVVAEVGACHRSNCTHNSSLECHASTVRIGAGPDDVTHAGCLTFETR